MEAVLKAMIPKGFMLLERQARNKPTIQKETPRKGACLITWPQVEGGEENFSLNIVFTKHILMQM